MYLRLPGQGLGMNLARKVINNITVVLEARTGLEDVAPLRGRGGSSFHPNILTRERALKKQYIQGFRFLPGS